MASSRKLILRFGTTSGEKNFTYNYAGDNLSSAGVKSAMNAMIENGSVFKYPPLTRISAKVQVTEEETIDVD